MSSITTAGAVSWPRVASPAASRAEAASTQSAAAAQQAEVRTAVPSTRLSLAGLATNDVVYKRPQAGGMALPVPNRAWTLQQKDDISALMARNSNSVNNSRTGGSLAEQWRGLGGALLSRFATTDSNYQQALADYFPPPAAEGTTDATVDGAAPTAAASAADNVQALDAQALAGAKDGAVTVKLTVQTRSGQTVELKLAVNPGVDGKNRGIQVESTSSGPLSTGERKALAELAEGFDQVLEGLGQKDKLKLDMAGLMNYDSSVLAGLDLTVHNPKEKQTLSSFSLQLNADQKKLAFTGAAGDIALNLDTAMPLGAGSASQRQSAITEHLRSFDAAGKRGHADAKLLALFKSAFQQLQATPDEDETAPKVETHSKDDVPARASTLSPVLARQVQPLQSGLADFQASFSGDSQRLNDRGAVKEIGRADYQFSQKTTVKRTGPDGDLAIAQTQSEKLAAHYDKSLFGGMLDIKAGHYERHTVRDEVVNTTLIETAKHKLTAALKQTELHQLQTYEKLVNHRPQEQSRTPVDQRTVQRLR